MKTAYKSILIYIFVLVSFVGQVSVIHAQEVDYKLLAPLPLTNSASGPVDPSINPSAYISGVVKLAISLAGVLAVLMIIIAGFKYVTVENVSGKSSARQDINNALIGLFLAIAAYTILNLINPTLTNLTFSITPTKESSGLDQSGYCAGKTETRDGKNVCIEPVTDDKPCNGTIEDGACVTPTGTSAPSNTGGYGRIPNGVDVIPQAVPLKGGGPGTGNGFACRAPGPCQVSDAQFYSGLVQLKVAMDGAGIPWQITEAWPPIAEHVSQCHSPGPLAGACVDAAISRSGDQMPSPANVKKFLDSIENLRKSNQLGSFQYEIACESQTDPVCVSRVDSIKKAVNGKYKIVIVEHATGEHAHINRAGI